MQSVEVLGPSLLLAIDVFKVFKVSYMGGKYEATGVPGPYGPFNSSPCREHRAPPHLPGLWSFLVACVTKAFPWFIKVSLLATKVFPKCDWWNRTDRHIILLHLMIHHNFIRFSFNPLSVSPFLINKYFVIITVSELQGWLFIGMGLNPQEASCPHQSGFLQIVVSAPASFQWRIYMSNPFPYSTARWSMPWCNPKPIGAMFEHEEDNEDCLK